MKTPISAIILLIVAALNIADVYADIRLQVPLHHILEEMFVIALSGACGVYLLWSVHKSRQALGYTKNALRAAETQVKQLSSNFVEARHQFAEAIQQQFVEWQLSPREQELGFLLLKGLSFKEIAVVMETKEKTLRQQASNIYQKSGLDGRHALAAWFFEDFLAPINETSKAG